MLKALRIPKGVLLTAGLAAACALAAPVRAGEGRLGPEEVREAILKGRQLLLRRLLNNAAEGYAGQSRALTVLALLNCGVPATDATLARAIANLAQESRPLMATQYQGTYEGGLLLMVLASLKGEPYRPLAAEITRRLQRFQETNGGWGDNSRTQFALLGLKAAEDLGIEVPPALFASAYKYIVAGQNSDGGWGYMSWDRRSYGSMTAAGITSLYICGARARSRTKVCGEAATDRRLAAGLEWLARNFSVRTNPGRAGGNHFYYLYALERIGVLLAARTLGNHDWYREGAEFLVRSQTGDGSWPQEWLATEFALLFLGKGSQPVAIQKLRHDGDWNPDPYDVKELTERAAKDLNTPMTFQIVDQESTAADLAAAPILYLQGHRAFSFTPRFRDALRLFVEQGGFVFASACCGSKEFDRAFRAEMKKIFPDAEFEALAFDHPIYSAPNRVSLPAGFSLQALNTGCRTAVLYAPHDLCCGWGGCEGCQDGAGLPAESARALGVNMIAYALGFQRLRDKLEEVEITGQPSEARTARGALVVGQLYHSGDWNPDPAAIPNLTRTLREQAGMKAQVARRRVTLGRDDPGDYPLLYLVGHRDFSFTGAQLKVLREYLDQGGFLFGDCCCGKPEFDAAFRRLCEELYPSQKLQRLTADHAIFQAPFRIGKVEYKPAVMQRFPEVDGAPYLEGVVSNGRLVVVYSRFNLGCELQGHPCPGCLGVKGADAYHLAVNILLYALSH